MVNEASVKKKTIIDILIKSEKPVSGEQLASAVGISRVGVWKIISALKDTGYDIESTHSGYRLISLSDKPLPWEMPEGSGPIEYHEVLNSTMDKASKIIDSGCKNGTVIIAGTQTSGHSSDGREWKSPEGGLYFTRIRTLPFPSLYSGLYSISTAAAIAGVMRSIYNIQAFVDWPYSIMVEGKKVGGILTEFRGSNALVSTAASGVGINLNSAAGLPEGAASLEQFTKQNISAKKLTAELLCAIETQENNFYTGTQLKEYDKIIVQTGRKASIYKNSETQLKGLITNLHCSGCLLLKTEDNCIEYILPGDKIKYD